MRPDRKDERERSLKAEGWDEGYRGGYVDGLEQVITMLVEIGDNYAKAGSEIDSMLEPHNRHHYQEAIIRNQYNAQALCLKLEASIREHAWFPLGETEQEVADED